MEIMIKLDEQDFYTQNWFGEEATVKEVIFKTEPEDDGEGFYLVRQSNGGAEIGERINSEDLETCRERLKALLDHLNPIIDNPYRERK